jgi:hypothetical protein
MSAVINSDQRLRVVPQTAGTVYVHGSSSPSLTRTPTGQDCDCSM